MSTEKIVTPVTTLDNKSNMKPVEPRVHEGNKTRGSKAIYRRYRLRDNNNIQTHDGNSQSSQSSSSTPSLSTSTTDAKTTNTTTNNNNDYHMTSAFDLMEQHGIDINTVTKEQWDDIMWYQTAYVRRQRREKRKGAARNVDCRGFLLLVCFFF
ncbi:hypothetical protein QBC32DRAFT_313712 [Pseudoneurospora amorphoporcata]|uniref:Uncharacterized protein n=1 Tax=Pseudoneurospora amorphoporcata TaxID=241081 RepID=A0AAN6NXA5_9PEZI|nr:hypothetical protein QBC32DRAFT_313712 [Pseudoneurospora amorphoporcata]